MTVNISTNVKSRLLGPESFASIFNGGSILIYSGPQPDSADYPVSGTALGIVLAQDGAGLNFVLSGVWAGNDPAQSWRLSGVVPGTAGWFRLIGRLPDGNGYSFESPRIDGTIGTASSADLTLPSTTITATTSVPIQQFLFSFPPVLGA